MMRRFLCETSLEGYRALSVGRHLVYDSWDQVHAFLTGTLGPAHAALFAEPHSGSGVVAWMTTTEVDPTPVGALPEAERAAALERLRQLRADIAAAAEAKAASSSMEDQRWAALLKAVLTVPPSRDLADILYVADGQPVLVQWGTRDENVTAATATLQDKIAAALEPPPLPPMGAPRPAMPGSGPAAAVEAGPVGAGGASWGLVGALLLWLLFIALLAAIYWRLLLACVIAPPFGLIIGTCEPPAVVAPVAGPADRRAELQRDLDRLRGQLAQAPQCRVQTALLPPAPPPVATVPVPTPQPVPEPETRAAPAPVPETRAAPEPEPEAAQTDLDRARDRAGGRTGDVTVTLLWNGRSDLDLAVSCPNGDRLFFGNAAACGGELDIDANRCQQSGMGPCTAPGWSPTLNPVENAFFISEKAPRGTYRVEVQHFAYDPQEGSSVVPFALQVRQNGRNEVLRSRVSPGESVSVTEFTIE